MATYSVYDNILIKLESVFLKVEMEVDREITELLTNHQQLEIQLSDLKGRVEVLNSLKRTCELYCDNEAELHNLHRALFKTLCDKHLQLRFLQEKELLLNGYLVPMPEMRVPTVIELNKELKLRKRMQEIELLSSFLVDHSGFSQYVAELEKANEIFDLAVESGASDSIEETINIFQNYFEKILNIYNLDHAFLEQFKDFRTQIVLQANTIPSFIPNDVFSSQTLQAAYKRTQQERITLELEVDKLLYQFTMFQNGKKMILSEIKTTSGELESVIFKEYGIKQKIQELRQYKTELNSQKDTFMRDPTVDGYAEAVKQLEEVEHRFKRLMLHKNFDKEALVARFFSANKTKVEKRFVSTDHTPYNKILFLALHNAHIGSEDKIVILRLSKPSKLLNSNSGKFFYQRTAKTRSLRSLENNFKKYQMEELH
jgi:hypothetical protein